MITDSGSIELDIPRDREGDFEPKIVPKRKRRLKGFDDKIISLYARGMTVRDIQDHVEEMYGVEVSKDLISRVTDQVLGFPEAIESVFPQAIVQTCIVHMVRNSIHLVGWKDKRKVTADLKRVYRANDEKTALTELDDFEKKWGSSYPSIGNSWRNNWARVSPFFEFGPEIRRAIYTTNPIEALNRQLRKATKTRGMFPNDEAVFKLLWLAIGRASKKWTVPIPNWSLVLQQLAIHFEGRVCLEDFSKR